MTTLRVTTESGSVYLVDTSRRTAERQPGNGAGTLTNDGREQEAVFPRLPKVGDPWFYFWDLTGEGDWKRRVTTPVVEIEEIG